MHTAEEAHLINVQIAKSAPLNTWKRFAQLHSRGGGVKSLDGLESIEQLEQLTLLNLRMQDLSPLRELTHLTELTTTDAGRRSGRGVVAAIPR